MNSNFKMNSPIIEPRGLTQHIITLYHLDSQFKQVKDCILYSIPKKYHPGEVIVTTVAKNESCQQSIIKKPIYENKNVFNFAFSTAPKQVTLFIDDVELEIKLQNTNETTKISLIKTQKNNFIYEEKTLCLDVNDQCQEIVNRNCQLCPTGSYQVIASNCKTKMRKYCGTKACGGLDEPACLRGWKASGYRGDYCNADSPIAYCKKPYRVFCLDGELFCY